MKRRLVILLALTAAVGRADAPRAQRFPDFDSARKFVRSLKKENGGTLPKGGVIAEIEAGEICVSRPVSLTAEDSGEPDAPVVYRAAQRGKTVLSGAWKPEWKSEDGLLTATLPEDVAPVPGFFAVGLGNSWGGERPLSLYAGGKRLPLARWPNRGRHSIGADETRLRRFEPRHAGWNATTNGWFVCDATQLAAWAKEPDLWAHGWWFWEWADTVSPVIDVDPKGRRLRIDRKEVGFGISNTGSYFVLNARSEIDEPGEWMVDRGARRLYVKPPSDGSRPVVARAKTVLFGERVHDVSFEGFVFECSRGGGVVDFMSCDRVHVRASVVRHASGWGCRLTGCRGCRIEGCDFYDIGEGGVFVAGGDYKTLKPAGNVVDNCHITDFGRFITCCRPGISLNGVGNRATHNLVHHGEHQGIFFYGDNHTVGYNVLHDLCSETDDAGAIYSFVWEKGVHEGTVVEHNLITETGKHPFCGNNNGIYLDNATSGVTVRNNVIQRARYAYTANGAHNRFEGNVCVNTMVPWRRGDASRLPTKVPPVGCVISNNAVVACGAPLYQATNEFPVAVGGNLVTAEDPGFRDYFNFDWDAKPGSPLAKTVGDLKMRKAGLYASKWRISEPVKFGRGVMRPRSFDCRIVDGAETRIDVGVDGSLPAGVKEFAKDVAHGEFAVWGGGKVIWSAIGGASYYATEKWTDESLFFTPRYDAKGYLMLEGAQSPADLTEYELVGIRGAKAPNGLPKGTVLANAKKPHRLCLEFRKDVPVMILYRSRIPKGKRKL